MKFKTVELVIEGSTATLFLNRAESMNAMNVLMLEELTKALKEVESSEVKLLFITGKGRVFSSGGDLKTMLINTDESMFHPVMDSIKNMIVTLYSMKAVTVSFINGAAAGLGLSFALACDYVRLEKSAKIAMNFINIGLVPDGGGHFFLRKRIGEHRAKQVIWEGKTMPSSEALQLGIVDEIYEGDFEVQSAQIKTKLEARPLQAMIASKTIFCKQDLPLLIDTLNLETMNQLEMRNTDDHREGVTAFLEKRAPQFSGK